MKCPFCGNQSQRTDVCEMCGGNLPAPKERGIADITMPVRPPTPSGPLGAPAAPPPAGPVSGPLAPGYGPPVAPPPTFGAPAASPLAPGLVGPPTAAAPQTRVSLTGEVYQAPPPPQATVAPPGAYPTPSAPPPGAGAAAVSSRVTGQHASYLLPTSALTPTLVAAGTPYYGPSAGEKWERCLAMVLPTLLLGCLVAHFFPTPTGLWLSIFTVIFLTGVFLGASAAVPSYDDAYTEIGALTLGTGFGNPAIALVVYGVLGLIRQEWNTAVLAIGAANWLVPVAIEVAAGMPPSVALTFSVLQLLSLMSFTTVCTCTLGWIISSLFRPMNE